MLGDLVRLEIRVGGGGSNANEVGRVKMEHILSWKTGRADRQETCSGVCTAPISDCAGQAKNICFGYKIHVMT